MTYRESLRDAMDAARLRGPAQTVRYSVTAKATLARIVNRLSDRPLPVR